MGCKKVNKDNVSGGELVVIEDGLDITLGAYNFDTLNPILTKSKSVQRIMNIIYEPLFSLDEELSVVPVLAQSYSLSPDGLSIRLNLKDGVKWHDGTAFDSADVIYTLSRLTESEGIYSKIADKIESFTAIDENTVSISFSSPEPDFAYLLTFPILSSETAFLADFEFMPMGTGSYKLSSRTSTELYFEPNLLWHGGQPSDKNITVKILKDELTAVNALNVKEIDAVALESYDENTAVPKLNAFTQTVTTDNMMFLGFNTQSAVMTQNVRRAICEIVDKKKILETNAYGKGKVSELAVNPSSWAIKIAEKEKIDPQTLFENDGLSRISGVLYNEGIPVSARILVNSDNELKLGIANGICEMLVASGISTVVDAVNYDDYMKKIRNDDFEMFIGEVALLSYNNPLVMLDTADNYFNFDTAFLTDAANALYGVAEKDDVKNAVEIFRDRFYLNPPYLPLFFKNDVVIYGSYVSGYLPPSMTDTFCNIENWYIYDKNGMDQNEENSEE